MVKSDETDITLSDNNLMSTRSVSQIYHQDIYLELPRHIAASIYSLFEISLDWHIAVYLKEYPSVTQIQWTY